MTSDPSKCHESFLARSHTMSRWVVAATVTISLFFGFIVSHLSVIDFMKDVKEVRTQLQRIEEKVDQNTMALRKVEKIEGVDLVP